VQYISKKTNIRQTQIVTLTDYHRGEIDDIRRDKDNMLKEYEKKKEGAVCDLFDNDEREIGTSRYSLV
jgi:hypothetical protein